MKFHSLIFVAEFLVLLRNIDANPIDISTNASTLHSIEEIPKHIRSNILWAMAESFGVAFQKLKETLFPEYYGSKETPLGSLGPLVSKPELTLSEVTSIPERDVGAEWDSDKAFASPQTGSTSEPESKLEKLYDAHVSSGKLVSTDPSPVPFEAPKKKHGGGGDLPIIRSEGATVDSANDTSTRSLKTVTIPLDMRMNGSIAAVWEEGDTSGKEDNDQVLLPFLAILPVPLGPYSTTGVMEKHREETLTTSAEQVMSSRHRSSNYTPVETKVLFELLAAGYDRYTAPFVAGSRNCARHLLLKEIAETLSKLPGSIERTDKQVGEKIKSGLTRVKQKIAAERRMMLLGINNEEYVGTLPDYLLVIEPYVRREMSGAELVTEPDNRTLLDVHMELAEKKLVLLDRQIQFEDRRLQMQSLLHEKALKILESSASDDVTVLKRLAEITRQKDE